MNDRIYWAITSVCVGVTITVSIMFVAVSIPAEVHATDGPMETRTLCFERETFDFDFPVGIVQTHWGDDLWRQMPVTVSSPRFAVTDAVIDSLFDVLDERMSGMSDLEKANALHDFVYRNVDYRHDSVQFGCSEYVQYPSETLYNGKGDCEDSALLLHVLYDKAGLDNVLILCDGHVAVGVGVDAHGETVSFFGHEYAIADPTCSLAVGMPILDDVWMCIRADNSIPTDLFLLSLVAIQLMIGYLNFKEWRSGHE